MVIILLVTAVITAALTALGSHMLPDTIVIFSVVLLNAVLGFVQEGKAEGALDALRNMMVQECLVVRDGERQRLAAIELVPGDIVVLEAGDKVPADVRFLEVSNLHADESSLTGESVPVEKTTDALANEALVPGDQRNIGFSGTYISQGGAQALVFATGSATAFGQIADMVKAAESTATPLQQKMQEFVRSLIVAILAVGAFNFFYGLYLGYAMSYSFSRRRVAGGGGDTRDVASAGNVDSGPVGRSDGTTQGTDTQVAGGRDARCDLGDLFGQDRHAHGKPHDRDPDLCRGDDLRRHGRGRGAERRLCA